VQPVLTDGSNLFWSADQGYILTSAAEQGADCAPNGSGSDDGYTCHDPSSAIYNKMENCPLSFTL
jgi:hypothetical protein